jgi:hypothetical protein
MIDWTAVGAITTPVVALITLATQNRRQHRDTVTRLDKVETIVKNGNDNGAHPDSPT